MGDPNEQPTGGAAPAAARVERRVERDDVLLRDDRGQTRVEYPAPAVVVVRHHGVFTEALARATTAEIEKVIALARGIDLFFDGRDGETKAVDPKMRPYMDAWTKRPRGALRSLHLLPNSKLGMMMLTVANLLTGGFMQIHTSVATFDAALVRAVRGS
jgi:hypothetical protein